LGRGETGSMAKVILTNAHAIDAPRLHFAPLEPLMQPADSPWLSAI